MEIKINRTIHVKSIESEDAAIIFKMVDANRTHLRVFLSFVDKMNTIAYAEQFVLQTIQRSKEGSELAFIIFENNEAIGRVGIYKIDRQHHSCELGYWLVEAKEGKGIMTEVCSIICNYCFNELQLNRIEIRCGINNHKSQSVARKLNFRDEGVLREAELLNGNFNDLRVFSLLRSDLKKST